MSSVLATDDAELIARSIERNPPRAPRSIEELIANSSIGAGLANIRENGIDAELAWLEQQPSFRIRPPSTRKRAAAQKKAPIAKPRKRR